MHFKRHSTPLISVVDNDICLIPSFFEFVLLLLCIVYFLKIYSQGSKLAGTGVKFFMSNQKPINETSTS